MRRIKFVFAALAIVVASFAAFAGPSMADDLNCRDARGNLIRCDGKLYEPYNSGYYDNSAYYPPFLYPVYNPYYYWNWGDDFWDDWD
jgi:hypothetical protein